MAIYKNENGKIVAYAGTIVIDTGTIVIDTELSEISENPVQNKVVTAELNKKVSSTDINTELLNKLGESSEGALTFNGNEIKAKTDSDLSLTSENPVQNKAITAEINNLKKSVVIDTELSEISENPVQNKVIAEEINNLKKSVSDGKTAVANAVTEKGITTATNALFSTIAANIRKIITLSDGTDDANALAAHILTGMTAYVKGAKITGTMSNQGAKTASLNCGGSYTIPAGFHNGNGKVSANSLASQTVGDATSDDIAEGKIAWVNGIKIVGTYNGGNAGGGSSGSGSGTGGNTGSGVAIVTFADGTDEEILAMIQAHYDDKINLSDYWAVGDTRTVHLSAMSATGVGESHAEQDVQFIIADFDHDELVSSINGHTKAAVTLSQKNCLNEVGYINSSNTNVGGWNSSARRTWCNNIYYNAIPSIIKNRIKEVNKTTSVGQCSPNLQTAVDKIFLMSEVEIFGEDYVTMYGSSFDGEGYQYEYYKTSSNRIKVNSLDNCWWLRSPSGAGGQTNFCYVKNTTPSWNVPNLNYGISVCLCI